MSKSLLLVLVVIGSTLGAARDAAAGAGPEIAAEDTPSYGPAINYQINPAVAFNGTEYLVVWADARLGGDIYATRVAADGTVIDRGGFVVSDATNLQRFPAVASDGAGFLVVWQDGRNGSNEDIHGARVDAGGAVLDPDGIAITTAADAQEAPAVTFGGNRYLVAWQDRRDGAQYDVRGVLVAPIDGERSAELVVAGTARDEMAPAIAHDGVRFTVAYQFDDATAGFRIRSRRVDGDGVPIVGNPEVSTNINPIDQVTPSIAWNGTHMLVAWSHSDGIYARRITGDTGSSVGSEIVVSAAPGDKHHPAASAFGGPDHAFLVAWRDATGGGTALATNVARIAANGTLLDAAGIALAETPYQDPGDAHPIAVATGGPALVVWTSTPGAQSDILARFVDDDGSVPGDELPLSLAAYLQSAAAVASNGTDFVAAWSDFDGTTSYIRARRWNASGAALDTAPIEVATAGAEPCVVWDGASYLIAWQQWNGADTDIHARRLSAAGTLADEIVVAAASGTQWMPRAAAGADGSALVVWEDYRGGAADIYGNVVAGDGAVASVDAVAIAALAGDQLSPAVAFDGSNWIVVWSDYDAASLRGGRVDAGGSPLDGTDGGVVIADQTGAAAIAVREGGQAFVVWEDAAGIRGSDLSSDELSLAQPGGFSITSDSGAGAPAVVWDGVNLFVAWEDRSDVWPDLRGARVSPAGALLDPAGLDLAATPDREARARLAADGRGRVLLGYERHDPTLGGLRAYIRVVNDLGDGETCTTEDDCASGFCVGEVCCPDDSPCAPIDPDGGPGGDGDGDGGGGGCCRSSSAGGDQLATLLLVAAAAYTGGGVRRRRARRSSQRTET